MGFCNQLRALLRKNLIIWYRNLVGSLCEILFPLMMISIIVIIRQTFSSNHYDTQSFLTGTNKALSYYVDYDIKFNETSTFKGAVASGNPFSSCAGYDRKIIAFVGSNRLYSLMQSKLEGQSTSPKIAPV